MDIKKGQFVLLAQLPLLWISISFLIGVACGKALALPLPVWFLFIAASVLIFTIVRKIANSFQLVGLLCFSALLVGGARFQSAQSLFSLGDLAFYNDRFESVSLYGWLIKPPVYRDTYTDLWLKVDQIEGSGIGSATVSGLVLVRGRLGADLHYGDQLVVSGKLEAPENDGDFAYKDYLARNGIYSVVSFPQIEKTGTAGGNLFWRQLYGLRERSTRLLARLYPDPEASLLSGILLGDETGISDSLKSAFNDTGTRHIIAISGFNISIIAGVVLAGFTRWLGIRRGLWLSAVAIVLYTLLVGAGASVVRAAIMAGLALLARQRGRDQFGVNTLAFVGAVMAAINPLLLWDIGFQLSFAATFGLMIYSEPIRLRSFQWIDRRFSLEWAERIKRPLYEFVFMTVAAQITTLPLLLFYFQRFSLVSIPANVLVLPLQPALMILAGLSLMLGLLVFPLGQLFALASWPLASLTIRLVEIFASFPLVSRELGPFTTTHAVIYYFILLVVSVPALRSRMTILRLQPAIPAALLGVFTFAIWSQALAAPRGLLEITLLDVGGEALLIKTPYGRNILINGGPSGIALSEELGRMLPGSARDLDWVVVAGERDEQINGLVGRIDRLDYQHFAWATLQPPETMLKLFQLVEASGKPITRLQTGQEMDLGEGIALKTLSIGQRGGTLLLTWKNFQALFPLGLDFKQMDEITQRGSSVGIDLLLLADSGYPPLNSADWIESIDPDVLWLAGDGELSQDLLAAAGRREFLEVRKLGWLRATTDGEKLYLSTERSLPLMQP